MWGAQPGLLLLDTRESGRQLLLDPLLLDEGRGVALQQGVLATTAILQLGVDCVPGFGQLGQGVARSSALRASPGSGSHTDLLSLMRQARRLSPFSETGDDDEPTRGG